ncbi:heme oxygenase-like [Myxocyprinus asiaticus]|uniref:heme oxygenase-like n=1 Tax=Myxocyprinus asiaticus TaxID=70543 RepID=UPI0022219075|nr:heme oxygenase-like [Myxocyprinus asiaticus]
METMKNAQTLITDSELSEQIKAVTKDSHIRAENTELMLSYQRGHVTNSQYQLLLCSLYKIYEALEEELDRNASHDAVAPIYFPQELARLESISKDLEHFYGQNWKEKITVPSATLRYAERLREIGRDHPEYLVAHAYTRYLGDLSGGQVLGRITQKSLGLKNGEGLSFFSFPGVSSPNLFKQLYRSRMNSIELTETLRQGLLEEAVNAFELNIQVFNELQNSCDSEKDNGVRQRHTQHKQSTTAADVKVSESLQGSSSLVPKFLRTLLGVFVILAVGMVYAF